MMMGAVGERLGSVQVGTQIVAFSEVILGVAAS